MEADSTLAQIVEPSLGVRKKAYAARLTDPVATIVHTTGGGPNRRFRSKSERRFGYKTPFDAALRIYREIMKAGPHYVVGQRGEIAQMCPERMCAWHVGGRGGGAYKKKNWVRKNTAWWHTRWPNLEGPLDLAGGKIWKPYATATTLRTKLNSLAGSVNANTIGIEVVPPLAGHREPWSESCWLALSDLILDIAKRNNMTVDRYHVLTHSDVHPNSRSARLNPWDPPPTQWTWELAEPYLVKRVCAESSSDGA